MANELGPAMAYLTQQLKGDAGLSAIVGTRVFPDFVPQPEEGQDYSVLYPAIVFSLAAASDLMSMGMERVMARPLYLVRAIGIGYYGAISPAADRMDALLHKQTATLTLNGVEYQITSNRERAAQDSALSAGVRFSWMGGYYRLRVQGPPTDNP